MEVKAATSKGDYSCLDCRERHVGCHGTCERYLKFAEERRAALKAAYDARQADKDASAVMVASMRRAKKARWRKRHR